jgi:hypothetical protein
MTVERSIFNVPLGEDVGKEDKRKVNDTAGYDGSCIQKAKN